MAKGDKGRTSPDLKATQEGHVTPTSPGEAAGREDITGEAAAHMRKLLGGKAMRSQSHGLEPGTFHF